MVKDDNDIHWFNDRSGAVRKATQLGHDNPGMSVKSVTFIHAKLKDNPKGDPAYESNLRALSVVDRERLLHGNWNIRPAAGLYMKRQWVTVVNAIPAVRRTVRYWDRAATKATGSNDPDWTVGIKMAIDNAGILYIIDMVRMRESPHVRDEAIRATASQDSQGVEIGLAQDPGQAGVTEVQYLIRTLQGYNAKAIIERGDKLTRLSPFSAQAEAGNVRLLRGGWNDAWFSELEAFDNSGKGHDDCVDASSGAYFMLTGMKVTNVVYA
jgi:predicted phage terminase large subunit-like protein